ncbi:FecR domain-containing protein [Pseudopedobacter sp.]|uniref:FecR family protein n=1 Tax=Pseudopedobacter sp. TaxID=1936787 RepID=UPI003342BA82
MNRENNNSALEKLLSKYFETKEQESDSLPLENIDFDQEKSLRLIRMRVMKKRYIHFSWLAAACLLICLSAGFFILNRNIFRQSELLVVHTGFREVKELLLSDGTKVWVNANSRLKYPKRFENDKREIVLEGEAFFKVKRDEQRPFIISSKGIRTTVLGTSFNISSYAEDEEVKVTVISGKVAVEDDNNKVLLEKNQQAIYRSANRKLVSRLVDNASDMTAWREGKLVFNKTALYSVVETIQRNFPNKIRIAGNLKNCQVSADFTGMKLDKIMKILGEIVEGQYKKEGDAYYLEGLGCN